MPDIRKEYKVTIVCNDAGIEIQAALPEKFAFDTSSAYAAPFESGLNLFESAPTLRLFGMSVVNQAMTAQVWQGTSEIQFSLPLILHAETDGYRDVVKPIKDLLRLSSPSVSRDGGMFLSPGPRLNLQKMIDSGGLDAFTQGAKDTASAVGGALVDGASLNAEGFQKIANVVEGGRNARDEAAAGLARAINASTTNRISLQIGEYMEFDSVVIVNVSQSASVQPLASGIFQRVEVDVTFKTFVTPTADDFANKIFKAQQHSVIDY